MTAKIRFESVGKTFQVREPGKPSGKRESFTAIKEVSFDVHPGEFLVIVGPSGCGKSTLLDLLGGLTQPTSGRILLDGKPITGPGMDRGIVFQQYALFPWLTALQNVAFGLEVKGLGERGRNELAQKYLSLVGLDGFEHRHPHELSGGMKQRVAIARSLAYDPAVLLMDEPFAALDAQTRETLQGELVKIWQTSKKTIVFITHGIDEAVSLGSRVALMTSRPGRIKNIIDIPESLRLAEDRREHSEFLEVRNTIWSQLRDEVKRAQEQERRDPVGVSPRKAGIAEVTTHG
ncbi:MAG: transporter ATP-binding protein [Polyangiaceae bacterium]|nr:transporter ATP-binding protein [Polyangiaceae bacterium]